MMTEDFLEEAIEPPEREFDGIEAVIVREKTFNGGDDE